MTDTYGWVEEHCTESCCYLECYGQGILICEFSGKEIGIGECRKHHLNFIKNKIVNEEWYNCNYSGTYSDTYTCEGTEVERFATWYYDEAENKLIIDIELTFPQPTN